MASLVSRPLYGSGSLSAGRSRSNFSALKPVRDAGGLGGVRLRGVRLGVGVGRRAVLDLVGLAGVTVTVDAHLVPVFRAQQLVDREVEDLAGGVPQRHLDARGGGDDFPGGATVAGHLLDDVPDEPFDVQRVLAEQEPLRVLDEFRDATAPVGLADAGHAGVGLDLDEVPLEVALDDGGRDVGDLYVSLGVARVDVVGIVSHLLNSWSAASSSCTPWPGSSGSGIRPLSSGSTGSTTTSSNTFTSTSR